MLEKILEFMKSAGEIAMNNYGRTDNSEFKSEEAHDLITITDRAISDLFQKFIADNFSDLDYCIVDEESMDKLTVGGVVRSMKSRNTNGRSSLTR